MNITKKTARLADKAVVWEGEKHFEKMGNNQQSKISLQ